MSAPLSPPITYQQALEQAAAQIAELRTPKLAAEQAVVATAAAATTIISARDRAAEYAKQAIHQLWLAVNPYDETAVAAFAAQAARIMMAAQQAAAKAAAAGQAHQLAAVGVNAAAVQSVPLDVRAAAAVIKSGLLDLHQHAVSVDYAEGSAKVSTADMSTQGVFKRPAAVYRYAKSKGATDVQAQALAGQRIDDLVDDNLMLSQRLAQQQVLAAAAEPVNLDGRPKAKTKIIGYRRVIHPELSRGGTCGMCIAASDRIYHVAELLPIHSHCKCTIAAITDEYDPADDLNAVDLNQLYKDAGGTSVAHLKRTRYKVDQHGELGSVMVPQSKYKPRTTKSKVRVGGTALLDDQPAQADVAKQQLRVMEENLARLRSEGEPEDSSKIAYHEKLIGKLRRQAGEHASDEGGPQTSGGGGDDGGNRRGGSSTGFEDPDDEAVRRIAAEAAEHEPEISRGMRDAVRDSGGDLARLGTVLKSPASIAEKLQRLAKRTTANAGVVDDALRYTWVADDEDSYWTSADALVARFREAGYRVVNDPVGWKARGYRGRNVVLQDARGYLFEVQLHTADSLAAAEEAHRLYAQQRKPGTGSSEKKRLRKQQEAIFAAVPWPAGVPEVS